MMLNIYIATNEGRALTEHRTSDHGQTTVCGLWYDEFPEVPGGGKDWYFDHERRDVGRCVYCETYREPICYCSASNVGHEHEPNGNVLCLFHTTDGDDGSTCPARPRISTIEDNPWSRQQS